MNGVSPKPMSGTVKGIVVILILFVIVLVARHVSQEGAPETDREPIKIGVVTSLSGDNAFIGEGIQNAITLALEDLGDTLYDYEVIYEDDQLSAKLSASAVAKLVNVDKVDALISISSGTGNIVSPVAEENQVVHFGIATDPVIAQGEYNFIHWTPAEKVGEVFYNELADQEIEKISIVEFNHPGVAAAVDGFMPFIEAGDGAVEIVAQETFNAGETDFRTLVSKIDDVASDAIVLLAFTPEVELIARQIRDAGIETPFTAIESFELAQDRELFEGAWYAAAADTLPEFNTRYSEQFDKNQSIGVGNAYDVFNLIVYGFETATDNGGKPTNAEVADAIRNINDFPGILGLLNMNEGDVVASNGVIKIIENGEPKTVKRF